MKRIDNTGHRSINRYVDGQKDRHEGHEVTRNYVTMLLRKVAITRYFSMSDKFLIAKISKIILGVILSNNSYDISIATSFSFLKWYSNKKSIKN